MKKILSLFSVFTFFIILSGSALAKTNIAVNHGYWKGGDKFDIVVHENKGDKLKLYINDKNPVAATVNGQGWATFRKVKLDGTGKLSFTQVFKGKDNKSVEKPFNYTQQFTVDGHTVAIASFPPAQPTPSITVSQPLQPSVSVDTTNTPAISTPADTSNSSSADTGLSDNNLSNNNSYVNSDGTTVHSPAASTDGSIPAAATAKCGDGTFSFSQHRSGTCSHHGGVAEWL